MTGPVVQAVVAQGEFWLLEAPSQKARPVLVVTRNQAIEALDAVVIAPVSSTERRIPTCMPVGPDEGLDHDSVASFDNLAVVPKSLLTARLGVLKPEGVHRMCAALNALADC